ncbi:MAG: hypothetical protein P8X55_12115 [Desulfosarcinaceae bacterium]
MNLQNQEPVSLERPATWGETLLALGPFLMLPLFFVIRLLLTPLLGAQEAPYLTRILLLAIFLASLGFMWVVLVSAWKKSFPRWSFPYLGFLFLVILYLSTFSGTIFGFDFSGSWWLWILVLAIPVIGLLWAGRIEPISQLFNSVWQDWTLISFAFYGLLPLIIFAAYDEVHDSGLMQIVGMLILAGGAVSYMRGRGIWQRFASLLGGFLLAWGATVVYLAAYWAYTPSPGWDAPVPWTETLRWTSQLGEIPALLILAPVLLALSSRRANVSRAKTDPWWPFRGSTALIAKWPPTISCPGGPISPVSSSWMCSKGWSRDIWT